MYSDWVYLTRSIPTEGIPTGGSPTGGLPTGCNPTGGMPTGGIPTGGIPTGWYSDRGYSDRGYSDRGIPCGYSHKRYPLPKILYPHSFKGGEVFRSIICFDNYLGMGRVSDITSARKHPPKSGRAPAGRANADRIHCFSRSINPEAGGT